MGTFVGKSAMMPVTTRLTWFPAVRALARLLRVIAAPRESSATPYADRLSIAIPTEANVSPRPLNSRSFASAAE